MTNERSNHVDNRTRLTGSLAGFITFVTILSIGLFVIRHLGNRAMQKQRDERLQKTFNSVKQGDTIALVLDSRLLPMLVADQETRMRVKELQFFSTSIDPTDAKSISRLPNVSAMTFYCTTGTRNAIASAKSLSVQSLSFEMSDLSIESYLELKEFAHLKTVHFEHVLDDHWLTRLNKELPNVEIKTPHSSPQEPTIQD